MNQEESVAETPIIISDESPLKLSYQPGWEPGDGYELMVPGSTAVVSLEIRDHGGVVFDDQRLDLEVVFATYKRKRSLRLRAWTDGKGRGLRVRTQPGKFSDDYHAAADGSLYEANEDGAIESVTVKKDGVDQSIPFGSPTVITILVRPI